MPQHPDYKNDFPGEEEYSDTIRALARKYERPNLTIQDAAEITRDLDYLLRNNKEAYDYFYDDFLRDEGSLDYYPKLCEEYLTREKKEEALKQKSSIDKDNAGKTFAPSKAKSVGP